MRDPLPRRFCLLRRGRSKITQRHTHTLNTRILNLFILIWNAALIITSESCPQILVPLLFFWHWWSGSGRVFYFGLNDMKCICSSYHHIMTDETRIFGYLEQNFQLSQLGLNLEPALPGYHTCCESPQNFSSGPLGFHTGNKTAGKGYSWKSFEWKG